MKAKERLEPRRTVVVPKKFERFGFVGDEVSEGGTKVLIVVYNQNNKMVGEYVPTTNDQPEFNKFVRNLS